MADDKLHTTITYDFNKNMEGLIISPAYIHGLQRITNKMIINSDRAGEMPVIFSKFDTIVTEHELPEGEKQNIQLDEFESDIYTLFSLIQLFKFKAHEQGLEIETETTATKAEIEALTQAINKGENVTEQLKELNAKMTIVK